MNNKKIKRIIAREVLFMKKRLLLLLPILFLYGCATISYYDIQRKRIADDFWNDKISADTYKELLNGINQNEAQHTIFGALCEQCERYFTFNSAQWNSSSKITCPYCGRTQDIKMAANRYTYLRQQQEQQSNQETATIIGRAYQNYLQRSSETRQQNVQSLQKSFSDINKPGSAWNPIHIKVEDN